jgi:TrpR-related protein YerC/YecD
MSRVNPRFINQSEKMKYLDLLWTSIAGLQGRDEVKNFFKDLLSESEAIMLARRIQIAKMLLENKKYEEIVNQLHVGEDTVGKVQQWLTSGFGGYKKVIESFEGVLKKKVRAKEKGSLPYSFGWLKKKYPLHFLLFNLIDKKQNKK